jgi:hypothetical protein
LSFPETAPGPSESSAMNARTKSNADVLKLAFAGLLLCTTLTAGCAVRQPQLTRNYTLKQINDVPFLLPPGTRYPPGPHRTVAVPVVSDALRPRKTDRAQCSIHEPLFSLYLQPHKATHWIAEIPSPLAWEEAGDDEIRSEFGTFASGVEELERKGCLPPDASLSLIPLLVENLAVPLADTLFYRYSYRPGQGIVDLAPGMGVRIRRAEFSTPSEDKQSLANYLGDRTTFYEVRRNRRNELVLKLTKVEVSAGLSEPSAEDLPEVSLPSQTAGMRMARLFLLTYFVPKRRRRAAILVGTQQLSQMHEATAAIGNDPYIECSKIAAHGANCVAFEGLVTVSSELVVNVNGQKTYVVLPSPVAAVIPQAPLPGEDAIPESLAIRRLFRGKYVPVEFDLRDQTILKLPLVIGDRITWAQHPAQH